MREFVQRDLLLMSLAVLHRTLSVSANEEVEDGVERLLRIAHHVSERPALTVRKEIVIGYSQFGHSIPTGTCAAAKRLNGRGKTRAMGLFRTVTLRFYACPDG